MRSVYKRAAALLLAASLLTGCAARAAEAVPSAAPSMPGLADPWSSRDPWSVPDPWTGRDEEGWGDGGWDDGTFPDTELTAEQSAYGSAALVGWPTVLVSLYLDEAGGPTWTEAEIERSRGYLKTAVEWITAQCAAYNVSADIHCDDGTPDSGLFAHETFDGHFIGGSDIQESDDFYDFVEDLCRRMATPELAERYGTSSIGFLMFLPLGGTAFTIVHYFDEEAPYYYEYCCLYQYDCGYRAGEWNNPATYAHEILHLYGAPDLYEGSSDPYVSDELLAYVESRWPDAIMNYTYEANGHSRYDAITRTLDPLSAYRLGLCATWEGLELFPDTAVTPPGVFTDDNTPLEWSDGSVGL